MSEIANEPKVGNSLTPVLANFATKIFFSTTERLILLELDRAIYDSMDRRYNLYYIYYIFV